MEGSLSSVPFAKNLSLDVSLEVLALRGFDDAEASLNSIKNYYNGGY